MSPYKPEERERCAKRLSWGFGRSASCQRYAAEGHGGYCKQHSVAGQMERSAKRAAREAELISQRAAARRVLERRALKAQRLGEVQTSLRALHERCVREGHNAHAEAIRAILSLCDV